MQFIMSKNKTPNPAAKELSRKQFHPKTVPDRKKSKMEEIAEKEWQELVETLEMKSKESMKNYKRPRKRKSEATIS